MLIFQATQFLFRKDILRTQNSIANDQREITPQQSWFLCMTVLLCFTTPVFLKKNKPNAIPTFGIRIAPALTAADIKVRNIKANPVIDTPPWTLNKPGVNFSITADKKDNTDAFIFKTKFQEITSHYPDFKHIYTDGSKDVPKVAAACVSRTQSRKCHIPDNASIFSAESQAINMALDYIEEANLSKVVIFSDLLYVLQSINSSKIDDSVIQDIILR